MEFRLSKTSLKNLILGIVCVFLAVIVILFSYGYVSGLVSEGGDIIIKREGISSMFEVIGVILLLGLAGGFEIGRYAEMEFNKRKSEKPSS